MVAIKDTRIVSVSVETYRRSAKLSWTASV